MRFAAYPKYKPSGVEWLGDVPEHWDVKRGRFCMDVNPSSPRMCTLRPDDEVSFIPMEAVGEYGGLELGQTRAIADVGSGYTEFEDGDVVVAKITPCFENGKGALATGLLNGAAFGTTELHVLRSAPILERRFLFYFSISRLFRSIGEGEMYGAGGQKRVPPEFCENVRLPLPPIDDQCAIADFLDRETAKVDTLVAKKRLLIERLKEKRTALISRTVTRGLSPGAARAAGFDPHPKLKPSGIDWLGDVPEHWEIKKLRYIGEAIIGLTFDPSELTAAGVGLLLLRASNVFEGRMVLDDALYVSTAVPDRLITRVGDILICSRSGSRALIGKNAMIDAKSAGLTFGTFMTVFRSSINKYLFYVFNSPLFDYQSGAFLTSTINQLTISNLYSFDVPLPPANEQEAIAAYLAVEIERINGMVSKVEIAIQRLQEYRTALITAAVTGKIDVRGLSGADAAGTMTA